MPKGSRGEKRPADTVGPAVPVAEITTGEIDHNTPEEDAIEKAARAASMMARQRSEIARLAAESRWKKS